MRIDTVLAFLLLAGPAGAATTAAPPSVAPLRTLQDAEAYATAHGIALTEPRAGVHATRDGHTLYDETIYRANGAETLTVLRFADAAAARDMAPVVVEADPAARALIRGQIVFLVSGNPALLASLTATPAAPKTFADAENLLAARGLRVAERSAVEQTVGPEAMHYTLADGNRVSVFRFESEAAAAKFRDGATKDGDRALARGGFVFLVPRDSGEAGARIFDLLAAR